MAHLPSYDELCKASETTFEAHKYEVYCRSMPKLLSKATDLQARQQEREAFVLLWRAAFLAAEVQRLPHVSRHEEGIRPVRRGQWCFHACASHLTI